MARKKTKLVLGVGRNDADYQVYMYVTAGGVKTVVWRCPFYRAWKDMMARCYSAKRQASYPSYAGCSVDQEWHSFSSFRSWMMTQEWEGNQLDKDLLFPGNRIYSPDACVFVSRQLNSFVIDHRAARGEWPIGVCLRKRGASFQASCNNPFTGGRDHVGYFDCPSAAHEAWRKRKHELACKYADLQTDPRISAALRARYSSMREAV